MITIQLNITPTDDFADVEGCTCRIWKGRTTLGAECLVYVRTITMHADGDGTELDAALTRTRVPAIQLRPTTEHTEHTERGEG